MSNAAISPVEQLHAVSPLQSTQAMSGPAALHDPMLQAMQLAQQQQMFSSMMSQSLQAPKDDDEDDW